MFGESFKITVVREYTSGNLNVGQLCKILQLRNQNVYNWIYKYSNIGKPENVTVELK